MAKAYHCQSCGKRRVNITVVHGLDVCPECATQRRREIEAQWRLDVARVERFLSGEPVPRQARTVAKCTGLDVERTRLILRTIGHKTPHGLWVWQAPGL